MKPTTDKKLQQFLKEVTTLSEKYQYQLVAQLDVTKQGVMPHIVAINVPPKEEKGKNASV